MTRTPFALLAAATSLAVVLLAPDAAPARPRWTGVRFAEASETQDTGSVALRGQFVRAEIPWRYRSNVWKTCSPGRRVVLRSDSFATSRGLVGATIEPGRSFTVRFPPSSVDPRSVDDPHAELVACSGTKFQYSSTEGVGGLFDDEVVDALTLAATGSNEAATAYLAAALLGGGMLLLFWTRRRRRPSLPSAEPDA
jgi:LPXTG-motif cell wall-anchored protein